MTRKAKRFGERGSRAGGQAGMSLIEVIIAMALILVIALGVLPMFGRALASSNRAWEATEVGNYMKSDLEEAMDIDFNNTAFSLPPTAGVTEVTSTESWEIGEPMVVGDANEGWFAGTPGDGTYAGAGNVRWTRTQRLRQFSMSDLNTPVDGTKASSYVHLKEFQVQIEGVRQAGVLGAGQTLTIRILKAY